MVCYLFVIVFVMISCFAAQVLSLRSYRTIDTVSHKATILKASPKGGKSSATANSSPTTRGSDSSGYGPFGSLVRQGPVPFFIRLAKPETYEEAVNKYMLLEKCDRATAQGNMDAYFQDPNGWASRKMRVKKGLEEELDYANLNTDKKQLVLTAVWAVGILSLFYRIFAVQVLGQ